MDILFNIGDKVVYPMHGAGIIEAIEEKEVLGNKQLYYVIMIKNMQIMFPMESKIGIRQIVDEKVLDDALTTLSLEASEPIRNPTQRQRNNMSKLKTGDIYEGAEVIRDLTHLSNQRPLAMGDKTMLDNAKQILSSELGLVKGVAPEEAEELLAEVING